MKEERIKFTEPTKTWLKEIWMLGNYSQKKFLKSVYEWGVESGFISGKQYDTIMEMQRQIIEKARDTK